MFPIRSVQGRGDRLRRPRARPRRAQVPELAGDAGVQQGPRALRPVRGAHRASASAATRWSSRATWTWWRWPSRASATRSRRSAPPAPPSTCRSCSASPTRWSSASTATPPAAAPPARALEASLPHASDTRSVRFLFLPAEHDPDSYVRELGAEAFEQRVDGAVPLSRQIVAAGRAKAATSPPPKGRARFLANARPLWIGPARRHAEAPAAGRDRLARRRSPPTSWPRSWRVGGRGCARRPAAPPARPAAGAARRRRPTRQAIRQPPDRVAWLLLLESALVGGAERRRPRAALRPARLARRAVPLPRPRDRGARRRSRGRRCANGSPSEPWARRGAGPGRSAKIRPIEPLARRPAAARSTQLRHALTRSGRAAPACSAGRLRQPNSAPDDCRESGRYNPRFSRSAARVTAAPPGPGHPLNEGLLQRPPFPARTAASNGHASLPARSPRTGSCARWNLAVSRRASRCRICTRETLKP